MHKASALTCARAGLLCLAAALPAPPAVAQTRGGGPAPSLPWSYFAELQLLPGTVSGDWTVRGVPAQTEGNALNTFGFGGRLELEMSDARWAFALCGTFTHYNAQSYYPRDPAYGGDPIGVADGHVLPDAVMAAAFRRWGRHFEWMAGLQFNDVQQVLQVEEAPREGLRVIGRWLDPYVGIRLGATRRDDMWVELTGAVGGLGIGSELATQLSGRLGRRFNESVDLTCGFRATAMDYEHGRGAGKFAYDLATFDVVCGARHHF